MILNIDYIFSYHRVYLNLHNNETKTNLIINTSLNTNYFKNFETMKQ
jgi:hypothetical protein